MDHIYAPSTFYGGHRKLTQHKVINLISVQTINVQYSATSFLLKKAIFFYCEKRTSQVKKISWTLVSESFSTDSLDSHSFLFSSKFFLFSIIFLFHTVHRKIRKTELIYNDSELIFNDSRVRDV